MSNTNTEYSHTLLSVQVCVTWSRLLCNVLTCWISNVTYNGCIVSLTCCLTCPLLAMSFLYIASTRSSVSSYLCVLPLIRCMLIEFTSWGKIQSDRHWRIVSPAVYVQSGLQWVSGLTCPVCPVSLADHPDISAVNVQSPSPLESVYSHLQDVQ